MSSSSSSTSCSPLNVPQTWTWRGFPICYQHQGETGTPIVLIHGFGASWGHWRKNIPGLSENFRVYAIDLIGFGGSAKPVPGKSSISYTFETWGQQISDFCREVVGEPVFLVGNSIGCIAAMQAAVDSPEGVQGVVLINCSLRLLHDRRRSQLPWYRSAGAPVLQSLLGIRWLGHTFFKMIAKPKTVRKILLQAYKNPEAVTDELVNLILNPAADPGAVDVFLAFTRYSQGPLPEDLLEQLTCPVLILWGTDDPWEPIALGRELAEFSCVQDFVPLAGAGHCPQDEIPDQVNALVQNWIVQQVHSRSQS
ncbi:alpha/beta fold hydrolase [Egbenema bharatensis]|uniref:alpha/beta fold hydrolase n=1 Tax=Egbenema bharatensis TaxID=3463334 RepID=UPI003A8BA636